MSHYIITNETSSDVVIEDIGVRLSGRGSTTNVGKTEFESSYAMKKLVGIISWKYVGSSVWPLSAPDFSKRGVYSVPAPISPPFSAPVRRLTPVPVQVPVQVLVQVPTQPSVQSPTQITIEHKLDSLISAISILVNSNAVVSRPVNQFPDELVFIPSSIVPVDAKTNVVMKNSESDSSSIDESAAALRSLRKK